MDGKGRWKDNVFIERFWRTLKYEEVYLHAYTDLNDARTQLSIYMTYYNQQRTHSSLAKQTPETVYTQTMNTHSISPQAPEAMCLCSVHNSTSSPRFPV